MDLPTFRRGLELVSSELNKLSNAIRSASITSVVGGRFTRTPGGTTLVIEQQPIVGTGGGGTVFCPFKVTDASTTDQLKIQIQWGVIAGRVPTGMFPNDDPPLKLDIAGTCYVYAQIDWDRSTLQSTGCSFTTSETVLPNTTTSTFQLVATVHVNTDVSPAVIDKIMNVCQQPVESPCGLAAS
jgi:hypothetical protein